MNSRVLFSFMIFSFAECDSPAKAPLVLNKDSGIVSKKFTYDSSHVLRGTTVLAGSDKNLNSRWVYGLSLVELSSTDCMGAMSEHPTPTEITAVNQLNDSTISISANIYANCGQDFLGEIEIVSENTLNLVYHGYGDFASCNCCFGLTYTIDLPDRKEHDFRKIKFVTINGIASTRFPTLK